MGPAWPEPEDFPGLFNDQGNAQGTDPFVAPNISGYVIEFDSSMTDSDGDGIPDACPCLPPPAGLVAWWDGDLIDGTTVGDRIGGHHGTSLNGVALAGGMVGQALLFDGVDDVVSIPHHAALQPPLMTVDAWIVAKPSVSGDHQPIIDKSHGFVDATGWALQVHPDGRVGWAYGNGSGFPEALSTTVVTDNQPHFIAGTFDGATLDLYVDGILEGAAPFSGMPAGNDRPVHIGAGWGGDFNFVNFVRHFHGIIDEVELFDRALAAAEVQAIYNAGSAGKCKQINQPPVARCQNVTVYAGANCQADVTGAQVDNGSSDPDGDALMLTLTPAGPYSLGTTEVTLTVDDGKGGTSSCSALIVVVDSTPPSITCPASLTVAYGSVPPAATTAAEFIAQGGSLSDHCASSLTISSTDVVQGSCPQQVTRTYTMTDAAGNSSTCQQIITVNNLFAADAIIWHQPLARNGASEDTDPSAGGTLKYRFKLGSTIPIQVHALNCAGAEATSNANVTGRVTVFGDSNCAGAVDASAAPIDYNGVGGAGGAMDRIDGHLKYNLDTKTLPTATRCYILRVTTTDTSTGEEKSEEVLLEAK